MGVDASESSSAFFSLSRLPMLMATSPSCADARNPPVCLAGGLSSQDEPARKPAVPDIINVRLTLNGRAKTLRHAASTKISHLVNQYGERLGYPIVVKDTNGFEVGLEVALGQLAMPRSSAMLSLCLEADPWACIEVT